MKYIEALETIEKWLDEKRMRAHCRMKCKGKCCFNVCGEKRCERPPLPCAIYLCDELLEKIVGFHNIKNYRAKYLKVTSIIFGNDEWDMCDMGKIANDIDIEIPDELIQSLVTMKYEPDIHEAEWNVEKRYSPNRAVELPDDKGRVLFE